MRDKPFFRVEYQSYPEYESEDDGTKFPNIELRAVLTTAEQAQELINTIGALMHFLDPRDPEPKQPKNVRPLLAGKDGELVERGDDGPQT